jgi:hypothetical protein
VRQFKLIKTFSSTAFAVFCLVGCGLSNGQQEDVKSLEAHFFNYSPYENNYGARFMEADKPFRYDKAAWEGCCFRWNSKQRKPISLRVIWAVIFDEKKYKEGFGFDEYTNPKTRPGVAWCEANTKIQQPYPADPWELILEAFPDGSVKAHFTAVSDPPEASRPLPKEQYNAMPRLPKGQHCLKEIANPKYGLARPKHYE